MIKNCHYCGAEVPEDSEFCDVCEKNLNKSIIENRNFKKEGIRCDTCGKLFLKHLKKCPYCGAKAKQIIPAKLTRCKNCYQKIANSVEFCPYCGVSTNFFTTPKKL